MIWNDGDPYNVILDRGIYFNIPFDDDQLIIWLFNPLILLIKND